MVLAACAHGIGEALDLLAQLSDLHGQLRTAAAVGDVTL